VSALLRAGTLVAPFSKRYESTRGYFAVVAPHAHTRADVAAFVDWLKAEALQEVRDSDTPPKAVRRAPRRKGR
jgi:DNA-binding transcriptional LysR family regulator